MQLFLNTKIIEYNKTILTWDVETDLREDLHKFTFIVQISESVIGPWINLFEDPIYAFGFVDTVTQRGMADKRLYYRVLAKDNSNNKKFYSNEVCLEEELSNYLSRYIARQERLVLRRYNGRECLLYPRKKFGPRCKHCYSEIDRKVIKSKCPFCFGTTYEDGYFAPMKIYINFEANYKSTDRTNYEVEENVNNIGGWTSTDSFIEADDILITLKSPDARYLVKSVTETSVKDSVTKQNLSLVQIKADRVEQLLPIDVDAYTIDEFNVFRRERNK